MKKFEDSLLPFLFENTPIRGNIVHLNQTYQEVLQHQTLPLVLKQALGELMAARPCSLPPLKWMAPWCCNYKAKVRLNC